jgi:rod shape-determining protein MreC
MKKKIGPIGISVLVFVIILGTIASVRLTNVGVPFFNPVGDMMNRVLHPVEGFFLRAGDNIRETSRSVFAFRDVQQENAELRQALDLMAAENELLREKISESERYEVLEASAFQSPLWDQYDKIGAAIVARNQNNWYQMIKINKGRRHGIVQNAPVVADGGLVGKVVSLTESTADVLLITDPQGQASSFIRREQGEAVFGVLYGTHEQGSRLQSQGALQMDFKQEDEVLAGDLVMTSGLGGVFPKGIIIGTVSNVIMNPSGLMKAAQVTPAVRFDTLEEVYVMVLKGNE